MARACCLVGGSSAVCQATLRDGLAIYLPSADPSAGDQFGRLFLSKVDLAARDRLAFSPCRGMGLPVTTVMLGGYGRWIRDATDIYLATVCFAAEIARGLVRR